MLSKQEQQLERRETLDNDRLVREQGGSTFLAHIYNDVGGRFAVISSPVVVGEKQIPQYAAAFLQHDPVPTEPPLGFDNRALEPAYDNPSDFGPSAVSPAQGNSGDATAPSTPACSRSMSERGSPSLSRRAFRRF